MGSLDLVRHLNGRHRDTLAGRSAEDLPPGHVPGPLRGMTVGLAATDLTLEHSTPSTASATAGADPYFADEHGVPLTAPCGLRRPGLTDR